MAQSQPLNYLLLSRVVILLLIVRAVLGLLTGQRLMMWIGILATVGVGWGFVELVNFYLQYYYQLLLPGWTLFAVAGDITIDALGNIFSWYDRFTHYDLLVHFVSGLAFAVALSYFFVTMARREYPSVPLIWPLYVALTTTLVGGLLFEFWEYAMDVLLHIHYWVGSWPDTTTDLLMDTAGSITAGVLFFGTTWQIRLRKGIVKVWLRSKDGS